MSLQAVQERIESCQGLVRSIALAIHKKLCGAHELDDLIAYGQLGSAQAAREFDPSRNAQFSTYAYYRIRGAIYDGIGKMGWKRLTERRDAAWNQILSDESDEQNTNNSDSDDWLQGVTERMATASMLCTATDPTTMDVEDDAAYQPVAAICSEELRTHLHKLVDQLPTEIAQLIRETYFAGSTMQDAANQLGISKSWASSLHARGLKMLAERLRRLGLDE